MKRYRFVKILTIVVIFILVGIMETKAETNNPLHNLLFSNSFNLHNNSAPAKCETGLGIPDSQKESRMATRHSVEIFPVVALFRIYSAQYLYDFTPNNSLILGLAYVNIKLENKSKEEIGQFYAPTIPVGYRRYLWKNLFFEYQLWPAYNFYYEKNEQKYYNSFDLYSEFRAGYRFDFSFAGMDWLINLGYVYGLGIYPGHKPESFMEVAKENPHFHAPVLAIGLKW